MFDKIIAYSIRNKLIIGIMVLALMGVGIYSLTQLPIDAVPDITNNQVQVITISPTLATQEVEQFITAPVELSLQNLQSLEEIRSISRFGLSVVTVVFEENMDLYLARQLVDEALGEAQEAIPPGLGTPEMAPISTGLGEIYQYVVRPKEGFEDKYSPMELRSIQDWIVKRQLGGIEGVVEINSFGGHLKQYEVAINPNQLKSMNITLNEVYDALVNSNQNTGGAYIEKNPSTYYIRSEGLVRSLMDIENIVVRNSEGIPVLVKDVAKVQFGKAPRYGAMTRNGQEVVGGIVMMLKGANSAIVTERIKERVAQIQKSMPEGTMIDPFLVRDKLVNTAIGTVQTNLLEGGLIVIFILVIMLGNWRAGLIVASVIPLAMLFAVTMMNLFGISANLMSLGAIDFGLIVDGAVIIVESIVHRLQVGFAGKTLSRQKMDDEVLGASQKIRNSAAFGEIIILMVYIPILALVGVEGKMFKPMAQTVSFAILGALILSMTYVPMMTALFLNKKISNKETLADKVIAFFQKLYTPVLNLALRWKAFFVIATAILFALSIFTFSRMGGEFIPTLEEGDLAMHQILPPGSSLSQSVEVSKMIQEKLMADFPEIIDIVAKIGSAEVPTDPMPVEVGDVMLIMKPKSKWTSAKTRQELYHKMEESLQAIPGIGYEFSQPIQMRFNELMTGTRSDIAIKLYGEDLDLMFEKAKDAQKVISGLSGIGSTNVEQTIGMPQIFVSFDYAKMAQYGIQVRQVNTIIRSAFAGEKAGVVYEGEKRFDLVVRMDEAQRTGIEDVKNLFISLPNGQQIPLSEIANISLKDAPMQISRDNTLRRIVIGVNVGSGDVQTLVKSIQSTLDAEVELPPGYYFSYGGQFENLEAANRRLSIAVPVALAMIFILLFFTFGSASQALLIFTAIPLSAIGGIWALWLRGMPFSISAGIGFIALFGVAVLNGIVLIGYFNQLKKEGIMDIRERILKGTAVRLRPVLLTASVASLGFLPMAISTSGGSEVQRPLATVVIGGLITATFLTLVIIPILYGWLEKWQMRRSNGGKIALALMLATGGTGVQAQEVVISPEEAIEIALQNHPSIHAADLQVQKEEQMTRTRYTLGPTEVFYQGDGLFTLNPNYQHTMGVSQHFPNPSALKWRKNIHGQSMVANGIRREQAKASLKMKVMEVYYELQQKKQLQKIHADLTKEYERFFQIASKQVEFGNANKIELMTVEFRLKEIQLLSRQMKREQNNLLQQFNLLLLDEKKYTVEDSLTLRVFRVFTTPQDPFEVQLATQQVTLEKVKLNLNKANKLPGLDLSYAPQYFHEGGWLNGVGAAIQLPLFTKYANREIQSQKIQIEASEQYASAVRIEWEQKIMGLQTTALLYQEGATFYLEQINTMGPELLRISKLNYESGEITAREYLNALDLWAEVHKNYLEQVLACNKAILTYQFLTGF